MSDDFVSAFTSFMHSHGEVVREFTVRIIALERYLKYHDSSFSTEYHAYLLALRNEARKSSDPFQLLTDDKLN